MANCWLLDAENLYTPVYFFLVILTYFTFTKKFSFYQFFTTLNFLTMRLDTLFDIFLVPPQQQHSFF